MSKKFEMTGSPKNAGFSTKSVFVEKLSEFGWEQAKMTKKNNVCDILVTDDMSSTTRKVLLANELGVTIMTYTDIVEMFDLEGDY